MLTPTLACLLSALPLASPHAPRPSTTHVVLRAPWGNAPGAFGKRDAHESAPEGPASFAVGAHGEIFIVDQVNARLQIFTAKGALDAVVPLDAETFQDIAVLDDGTIALVDRFGRESVRVIAPSGAVVHEDALLRAGIDEGGAVTALLPADDGVYVELEHARSLRVLDTKGDPVADTRTIPGRPVGVRGLFAGARLVVPVDGAATHALDVWLTDPRTNLLTASGRVAFADPLDHISLVAMDGRGDVVVIGHTMVEERPGVVTREALEAVFLDEHLHELRRLTARPTSIAHEQRRDFFLGADGTLTQMRFDERGVEVIQWTR